MAGGSKSKNKGSGFERELCRILGDALGGTFIRSANSGAFLGGKNAKRKTGLSEAQASGSKGDLVPPEHLSKLVIEAKFYSEFRFHQLLSQEPVPQLDEWIDQSLDAVDPDDIWLIVFKVNRRGTYVFMPMDASSPGPFTFGNYAYYEAGRVNGVICDLSSFLGRNAAALCCAASGRVPS